jgi:MFS-type transporter involved in bile tolerance (Atg22 family)
MLPSGTLTIFRHNQQFFPTQLPSNPKCYHSSSVSDICSAHIHVGHISKATYQFQEISFNIFWIIRLYLYRVIILSDKYQLPLPVSLFTVLMDYSPGQQYSQSHSLITRSVPNCSSKPQFGSGTHHILTFWTSGMLQTQAATICTYTRPHRYTVFPVQVTFTLSFWVVRWVSPFHRPQRSLGRVEV